MKGKLMTNFGIEFLIYKCSFINFGAILTANIYSQSVKEIQLKSVFFRKSISNPYFIV